MIDECGNTQNAQGANSGRGCDTLNIVQRPPRLADTGAHSDGHVVFGLTLLAAGLMLAAVDARRSRNPG